jgi:uncharacterized protein (DUF1501 family)
MLDPDISTRDAMRLLTVREDPWGLDRRRFLQLVGMGIGAAALADFAPGAVREAFAAVTPVLPTDGLLVLVGFFGGLDGLNTVVPYTDGNYYTQHGAIAVPANTVLPLNGQVGLNPNLPYLKSLYDQGQVAVIQGVGYPDPDLSHFSSMATWMYGRADTASPTTGWIGRWLDGIGTNNLLQAVSVGGGLPLHLVGATKRGTAVPEWGVGFGGGTDVHDLWMYSAMREFSSTSAGRGSWHDAIASTMRGVIDVGQEIAPVFTDPLPDGDLVKKMAVAARLLNANLGLRVVDTGFDGFDNHGDEPTNLTERLQQFDAALATFFATLSPALRSQVTIMTYSEFGRTSWSNDSAGTDHGTANNHFVIGPRVKGGTYGQQPSLTGLQRWDRMDANVDFRSMYASVLDGWMGGGSTTVLGATFPDLGLFRPVAPPSPPTPPAQPADPIVAINRVAGDFVGLAPARLYDSREAPLGRPLNEGEWVHVPVVGVGGVPGDGVTAVALNVSCVDGSTPGSFTVWPTGGRQPSVANVTVPVGTATATMVVVEPGPSGEISVINRAGTANLIVDVIGFFRTDPAFRFAPLNPARLLDSRTRRRPIVTDQAINLRVRGVGGVPMNADSVVLNVTAVTPALPGFLTVYPTGTPRQLTSNLNFEAGSIIPNLVIAKVGANHSISIYNLQGATHVVVDVVGYFSSTAPGRYTPVEPVTALATQVGQMNTVAVPVLGVGDVPGGGVSAVAVNISVRNPSWDSYLVAWPSAMRKPTAANLTPKGGQNCSNMAFVKLGADGQIWLYNHNGTADVVVDILGWFSA